MEATETDGPLISSRTHGRPESQEENEVDSDRLTRKQKSHSTQDSPEKQTKPDPVESTRFGTVGRVFEASTPNQSGVTLTTASAVPVAANSVDPTAVLLPMKSRTVTWFPPVNPTMTTECGDPRSAGLTKTMTMSRPQTFSYERTTKCYANNQSSFCGEQTSMEADGKRYVVTPLNQELERRQKTLAAGQ
ncbi:hypothetical protein AB6A40_010837, partial [Gnathostoma spinigerum]